MQKMWTAQSEEGVDTVKTPEEIKKGLECCASLDEKECEACPYKPDRVCGETKNSDALAYIQQLEEKVALYDECVADAAKLQKERDAAVEDMTELMQLLHYCRYCKYLTDDGECTNDFADTDGMPWRCWQWRGVQEVE